jgi:cell division septum initiation protein DivIVA
MSVFEPHAEPTSNGSDQLPALEVVLRGRKGQQISAYIGELAARLDQQTARAHQAEQATALLRRELETLHNQPPPSFEHLGAEAAKVLEDAGQSAMILVEQAKGRGQGIIEQAKGHAAELVEAAEQDAHTRLDAARQAAEQMLAKANGERSVMEAETKRLREYRDGLLGHLARVQSDLAGFLVEAGDPAPAPGIPSEASGAAEADATQEAAAVEADLDAAPTVELTQPVQSAIGAIHSPR